jgi:hypothetical protein
MFSTICNRDRKLASSPYSERKPRTGTMDCCKVKTGLRPQHRWWRGTSGCMGSGVLLVLLPKCPMCIAAYLTLWTGAGVAMQVATHLRPTAAVLFCASALFLAVRLAAGRMRLEKSASRRSSIIGGGSSS